ncbi:uncharacterized protein LOC113320260 isoform X1 [Papaver somniferum]|uniref:uncharacterized protein LOC113320260 isoform X1 n=2 Tax=Papaver somniferum TaxID=3469 RepID=UPI000E6FE510|nr:uncharacterized protein LOC113320260 isoform X1 [Papaver somniferum]
MGSESNGDRDDGSQQSDFDDWRGNAREELNKYLPLYKAALEGNWEMAKDFFDNVDEKAVAARITFSSETALHVAAGAGHLMFMKNLMKLLKPKQLEIKNKEGETALQNAVIAGNFEAVKAMVEKNPKLTLIPDNYGWIPLVNASKYASVKEEKKEMIDYLYSVTRENDVDNRPSAFSGNLGAQVICSIIGTGFYDIAHDMVQRYPDLATVTDNNGVSALEMMAGSPHAFLSGTQLAFWERSIYPYMGNYWVGKPADIEKAGESLKAGIPSRVPFIKQLHNKKLMNEEAVALVKCICEKIISSMSSSEVEEFFQRTNILGTATKSGTVELVTECLENFPDLVWVRMGEEGHNVFMSAVQERQEKIFNLVYKISGYRKKLEASIDFSNNTILHLAAKLESRSKLSSVTCIALKVQREIQWFKEVESIVPPSHGLLRNREGDTAQDIFEDKEHKKLFFDGKRWMTDTSQALAFVSALILTVVFAATFTVPGGTYSDNNDINRGIPIFLHKNSFLLFAVSNAVALFSSTSSLLMFLALLTSQYEHGDFLRSLPKRLIIGLVTLFISIITMMVAFCATLATYLGPRFTWIPIPLSMVASVPVCMFLCTHLPMFVKMVRCTYGRGIFRR